MFVIIKINKELFMLTVLSSVAEKNTTNEI